MDLGIYYATMTAVECQKKKDSESFKQSLFSKKAWGEGEENHVILIVGTKV